MREAQGIAYHCDPRRRTAQRDREPSGERLGDWYGERFAKKLIHGKRQVLLQREQRLARGLVHVAQDQVAITKHGVGRQRVQRVLKAAIDTAIDTAIQAVIGAGMRRGCHIRIVRRPIQHGGR